MRSRIRHLVRIWKGAPVTRTACNRQIPKLAPGQRAEDGIKTTYDISEVTCRNCLGTVYYAQTEKEEKGNAVL